MCGIVGSYHFDSSKRVASLAASLAALNKRGPDARIEVTFGNRCALGHARLSIIDTSHAADQPMYDATGRFCIVFNGEIFNYLSLKETLANKGYEFKTQSDTEVILNLYIDRGLECVKELNGFFAFAIFDTLSESLFIARDRYGIKPLYYFMDENEFSFASELKALKPLLGNRLTIDHSSLHLYFQLNYIPGNDSIFKEIKQIKPGEAWLIKPNEQFQNTYYQINGENESFKGSYTEAQEKLKELLEHSVKLRLISDVPLGAFLSGGIDSSVIVALASKYTDHLNTFSIGYKDEPMFDETKYARLVAQKCKTEHTVFELTNADLFEHLFEMLDYIDEPFADSSALAVYILCKETRKHATVALSGDGADEIFGGYQKHFAEWRIQNAGLKERMLTKLKPLLRVLPQSRNFKVSNFFRQAYKFADAAQLETAERYWRLASINKANDVDLLLKNKVKYHEWNARKNSLLSPVRANPGLTGFLLNDTKMVLANDMLVKVDRMSMANSLEVRVPFLDYRVVDFAFSLPEGYKVSAKGRKLVVQEAFREVLPPELYHRPKHGFEVPLLNWFKKELYSKLFDDYLSKKNIDKQGIFDYQQIQSLKNKLNSTNPGDVTATLWALLVFQHWYRNNSVLNY